MLDRAAKVAFLNPAQYEQEMLRLKAELARGEARLKATLMGNKERQAAIDAINAVSRFIEKNKRLPTTEEVIAFAGMNKAVIRTGLRIAQQTNELLVQAEKKGKKLWSLPKQPAPDVKEPAQEEPITKDKTRKSNPDD